MLELRNIKKSFTTAGFTQTALNGVSLNFRKNEFVAILGPSGSGKTTLLNIIGGLDKSDSGDLLVDNVSTKDYKSKDWDAFRNNRIGFVFQSYNLIPHQTVLANVELALTLSGVSKEERIARAKETLASVGLEDHINKKPSQLSGGQMQRVAIARALINNPEIVLADEPTGALDSKTSVQIMDLLSQIAKDRLVVMVTHNPELAQEYATRTVTLADGELQGDTNPYNVVPASQESESNLKHTKMSLVTALSLSFNNLLTKKSRTLMTAIAGSIGILGIAAILSLANGVNTYIKNIEEETLSQYPLQIMKSGIDMTSMIMGSAGASGSHDTSVNGEGANGEGTSGVENTEATSANENSPQNGDQASSSTGDEQVKVAGMLSGILSSVGYNDLGSLKNFFDSGQSGIEEYARAIEYSYGISPQIYSANPDEVRQVQPDQSFKALGMGSGQSTNSLMSMSRSTDMFAELPRTKELYEHQYDVKVGHWPTKPTEVVMMLTSDGSITDQMLYTLGFEDPKELDEMVDQFAAEEEVEVQLKNEAPTYDEIMDVKFKLINAADRYAYDEEFSLWVDKSEDTEYMENLLSSAEEITISGIVQLKPDVDAAMSLTGLRYMPELTDYVIEQASNSDIVKKQLENTSTNIFSGYEFGSEEDKPNTIGFESLFTVDESKLQGAFVFDESAINVDIASQLDFSSVIEDLPAPERPDMEAIISQLEIDLPTNEITGLMASLMQQYLDYWIGFQDPNPSYNPSDPSSSPVVAKPGMQPLSTSEWLNTPGVQAQIALTLAQIVQDSGLEEQIATALQGYIQSTLTSYMQSATVAIQEEIARVMQGAMNQMGSSIAGALSVNTEQFEEAFTMNMGTDELTQLMTTMMSVEKASYDSNLEKLGYADIDEPDSIDIYPTDFKSKEKIVEIIDGYNKDMEASGEEDKVVTYTDIVGALMTSVTVIIGMITTVLVAFVAISLVVSSIMIGVITYISVLERKKEIGILRSIGASKNDISNVFNAETIIVGFLAGLIGVVATAILTIPANIISSMYFDVEKVAVLPVEAAVVLVLISVFLTFLGGLIPASAASKKDPVEALRSE